MKNKEALDILGIPNSIAKSVDLEEETKAPTNTSFNPTHKDVLVGEGVVIRHLADHMLCKIEDGKATHDSYVNVFRGDKKRYHKRKVADLELCPGPVQVAPEGRRCAITLGNVLNSDIEIGDRFMFYKRQTALKSILTNIAGIEKVEVGEDVAFKGEVKYYEKGEGPDKIKVQDESGSVEVVTRKPFFHAVGDTVFITGIVKYNKFDDSKFVELIKEEKVK